MPPELSSGPLSSLEALSEVYQGGLSINRNAGGKQNAISVQGGTAREYFLLGLSMVFDDLGPAAPSLGEWLRQLEQELGVPPGRSKLVGFASPKGEHSGLLPHWDAKEGILIQVQGRKQIRVAPNLDVAHPTQPYVRGTAFEEELAVQLRGRFPRWPEQGEEGFELDPGSVMFIPRGFWHTTRAVDDSLAVAVDFTAPSLAELLLPRLKLQLLQRPEWRRSLKDAWKDPASLARTASELRRLLEDLALQLPRLDAEEVAGTVDDLGTRCQWLKTETAFLVQDAQWSSQPASDGGYDVRITHSGGYGQTTLGIDAEYLPACRWILERPAQFTLGDVLHSFPLLGIEKARELVCLLVQAEAIQFTRATPA